MNTKNSHGRSLWAEPAGHRRGVALVIVLAMLVLIAALVVGFLGRVSNDQTSTASYSAVVSTRQLADMAVNLVQSQINDASNQGTDKAWASQPGAVRVFDNTGALQNIYRLYSASTMTTSNAADLANDVPVGGGSGWASSPALWVDLNAPVTVQGATDSSGNPTVVNSFPIIDPRDPVDPTKPLDMDGFFLGKSSPAGNVPGTTDVPLALGSGVNPIPMPVRWMYSLKNGELISPDSGGSGRIATFLNATPKPSKDNPIVGRIAFWTDDETCKVNINTAAGSVNYRPDAKGNFPVTPSGKPELLPAPWDTPRFGGIWEDVKLFAFDQPIKGEFQRYPGHPATTILYNIFSGLGISMTDAKALGANYNQSYSSAQNKPNATSKPTSLFKLLPRYNDDFGSNAGTANTTIVNANQSVTQKTDRLYSSIGEFLYAANFDSGSGTRDGNTGSDATALSRQQAETAKFFLTANSRAPEINLFGTPRIAMWPIPDPTGTIPDGVNSRPSVLTPFDKLIAFCATTGTGAGAQPYYFVRKDRTSPTVDAVTPQNAVLYKYLQFLTSTPVPGFGGTFSDKYQNGERDQILTEMVDYIRCTNPFDHSFSDQSTTVRYTPFNNGMAEIVPLNIGNTSGLGRINTISEVAIHVICTADGNSPLGAYVAPAYPTTPDGADATTAWSATSNPQGWKARVSKVAGSANDPLYVSNITEPQFLKTAASASYPNGQIVAIDGSVATSATPLNMAFKANPTLSTNGVYKDPGTLAGQTTADGLHNWLTPLTSGQRKLQAMLIFELASPMNGYDWMGASGGPDIRINVAGSNGISIAGANPFPGTPANATGANSNGDGYFDGSPALSWGQWGLNSEGGIAGIHPMLNTNLTYKLAGVDTQTSGRYNAWSGKGVLVPTDTNNKLDTMGTTATLSDAFAPLSSPNNPYRFVSNPFTAPSTGPMPIAGGCTVTLQLPKNSGANYGNGSANNVIYQTLNVSFGKVATVAAPPDLPVWGLDYKNINSGNPGTFRLSHAPDWWGFDNRIGWDSYTRSPYTDGGTSNKIPGLGWACLIRTDNTAPAAGTWSYKNTHAIITPAAGVPSDVVRSVFAKDGDYRITAAKSTLAADGNTDFATLAGSGKILHLLREQSASNIVPGTDLGGSLAAGVTYAPASTPKVPSNPINANIHAMGDWDNGTPVYADGAYANWPDHGNIYVSGGVAPYFNGQSWTLTNFFSYFTPNRIIPSPVMFGSLPTGVKQGVTWRTLLFRPALNRPADEQGGPKDYMVLDLFNMPVVEPYAISEPFSTAGKVNMNYQILPFTYITRATAIRAVLGSELVARIPAAAVAQYPFNPGNYYKGVTYITSGVSQSSLPVPPVAKGPAQARLPINLDEVNGTLRQFQDKFAGWNIFRSAAEICDIYLVPKDSVNPGLYKDWVSSGPPYNTAHSSWYGSDFSGVGDNVRERPYADIYPRLTTKSNTFTVHFTVQSLKNMSTNQAEWNEDRGAVVGEYRGSTTLERFLDPNDPSIPSYGDGTDPTTKTPIDKYYKWRVVANRRFYP